MPEIAGPKIRRVNNVQSSVSNENAHPILPAKNPQHSDLSLLDMETRSAEMSKNGQFDASNAAYKFAKGFFAPVMRILQSLFDSPLNFVLTATLVTAAILAASSSIAVPVAIGMFVAGGIYTTSKIWQFSSKLKNAKSKDDFENAFEDLGEVASSGFASFRVARSFLKGGNLLKFTTSNNLKSEVVNLPSSAMPSKTYVGLVASYLATALPSFFEKKEQKNNNI